MINEISQWQNLVAKLPLAKHKSRLIDVETIELKRYCDGSDRLFTTTALETATESYLRKLCSMYLLSDRPL